MNGLNEKERLILRLAQAENNPSEQDRARVRRALTATLATSVIAGAGESAAAAASGATPGAAGAGGAATSAGAAGLGTGGALGAGVAAKSVGLATIGAKLLFVGAGITLSVAGGRAIFAPVHTEIPHLPPAAEQRHAPPHPPSIAPPLPSPESESEQREQGVSPSTHAMMVAPDSGKHLKTTEPTNHPSPHLPPSPISPTAHEAPQVPKLQQNPQIPAVLNAELSSELTLLTNARRALSQGNASLALKLTHELMQEYPRGVFIEETRATKILALCATGQSGQAKREAARFFNRWKNSVYADKLRDSCSMR